MKSQLTIFDVPVFYTQGMSELLLRDDVFSEIVNYHSKESFIDQYEENPTDYVMLGSFFLNAIPELIDVLEEISGINSKVRTMITGNYFEISDIRKLFEKGIVGYFDRDTTLEEFLIAVKQIKQGGIYVCNSAKERMINFISNQTQEKKQSIEQLTKREVEVMKLICEGHSSKMISEKLFISVNTVETHRKKILMKFNVKNSIGIVKYAVENKMLE